MSQKEKYKISLLQSYSNFNIKKGHRIGFNKEKKMEKNQRASEGGLAGEAIWKWWEQP